MCQCDSSVAGGALANDRGSNLGRSRGGRARRRVLQDHVRAFFRDHDDRRIGVAGHDRRHDRAVDHAQTLDAMHAQSLVDDRRQVGAHAAGAGGMEYGRSRLARECEQVGIARALRAGRLLRGDVALERRPGHDPA